ncbi:MAG: hypothetical protein MHM6MM_002234 [Cercozoa sp. M6MM]
MKSRVLPAPTVRPPALLATTAKQAARVPRKPHVLLVCLCECGHKCANRLCRRKLLPRELNIGNAMSCRHLLKCHFAHCTPGYYCETPGLTTPTGSCDAGFFCGRGSATRAPVDGVIGDICSAGGYCPSGSAAPLACPAGTYSNATGLTAQAQCASCPPRYYCAGSALPEPTGLCYAGYYCDGGASTPTQHVAPAGTYAAAGADSAAPCPPGTYNQATAQEACTPCPAGSECPSTNHTTYLPCPQVRYISTPVVCPSGRFGHAAELTASTECQECTAGSYCSGGSAQTSVTVLGTTVPVAVAVRRKWCVLPVTTVPPAQLFLRYEHSPFRRKCLCNNALLQECPVGTYRPTTAAAALSDCLPCAGGSYCASTGLAAVSGNSAAGVYCTRGCIEAAPANDTNTAAQISGVCPTGHACPLGTVSPVPCTAGRYQSAQGQSLCLACPAGQVCAAGSVTPTSCTAGYYCPASTAPGDEVPCPIGRFSTATDLGDAGECTACEAGSYCSIAGATSATGSCSAGYFCPAGSSTATAEECPQGHYCPTGSSSATPCPIGRYSGSTQLTSAAECTMCDGGSYCDTVGLSAPTGLCTPGYYCSSGAQRELLHLSPVCLDATLLPTEPRSAHNAPQARYATQQHSQPCPSGSLGLALSLTNVSECTTCPAGSYCDTSGLTAATGACSAGYYCPAGSSSPNQEICPIGSVCVVGSAAPSPCPGGYACESTGLAAASATCEAGFYCPPGSSAVTCFVHPLHFAKNEEECPAAHYCPAASSAPTPCGIGTAGNATRLMSAAQCLPCEAGFVCASTGLTAPTRKCQAGYYCPSGTASESLLCPRGSKCPQGSAAPVPCVNNEYQDRNGTSTCKTVPAGFVSAGSDLEECPSGHFCPANNSLPQECSTGSYRPLTGGTQQSDCRACDGGFFCASTGLSTPTAACSAGHVCTSGASQSDPTDNVTGYICPAGHYCPSGVLAPIPCLAGQTAPGTGNTAASDCEDCSAGFYCRDGFVCFGQASLSAPTDNVTGRACVPGTYCEQGSAVETPCDPGTFNSDYGQSSCRDAPVGRYADTAGASTTLTCPRGSYCPQGTAIPVPCPVGTFGNVTGLASVSECNACTPGSYCGSSGLTAPTGPCDAGSLCTGGASSPTEQPCPTGGYCPVGSAALVPCAVGKYGPATGVPTEAVACVTCPAGRYCDSVGMSVTRATSPGYYSDAGASADRQHVCSQGYYCPSGTPTPLPCPQGNYQPAEAQPACLPCPAGTYCSQQNTTTPTICPYKSFCPEGSATPTLCLPGSYGKQGTEGKQAAVDCTACPATKYCSGGIVQGLSSPGYLCRSGCASPTPASTDPAPGDWPDLDGGPCPAGYVCPDYGTSEPTACPAGTVREQVGGISPVSDCGPCPAGRLCVPGNPVPLPCPEGSYCPFGESAILCPTGRYGGGGNASSVAACDLCPAGYLCSNKGLPEVTPALACPSGYFCVEGSGSNTTLKEACPGGSYSAVTGLSAASQCTPCPAESYCPEASVAPLACPEKYYCPSNSSEPLACPGGSYCPAQSALPVPTVAGFFSPPLSGSPTACFIGHYCPSQSHRAILCPAGSKARIDAVNLTSIETACETCQAGTHGGDPNRLECLPCDAGFVCEEGATRSDPQDRETDRGFPCPRGYLCPQSSVSAVACPEGTYNPLLQQYSADACWTCPSGSYNHMRGEAKCLPCGAAADSVEGAVTCVCRGAFRVYLPDTGQCVCRAGYEYYDRDGRRENDEASSAGDCVPVTRDSCTLDQFRDAVTGECRSQCDTGCTPDTETGWCDCAEDGDIDAVCDATCRASVSVQGDAQGIVQVRYTQGNATTTTPLTTVLSQNGLSLRGTLCATLDCRVVSVQVRSDGVYGLYGHPVFLSASEHVSRPLLCLTPGDTILFDLRYTRTSVAVLNVTSLDTIATYPVFAKDALLNAGAALSFDFGAFVALARRIEQARASGTLSQLPLEYFAYTFETAGTYTFVMEGRASDVVVVRVLSAEQECPTSTSGDTNAISNETNGTQLLQAESAATTTTTESPLTVLSATSSNFALLGASKTPEDALLLTPSPMPAVYAVVGARVSSLVAAAAELRRRGRLAAQQRALSSQDGDSDEVWRLQATELASRLSEELRSLQRHEQQLLQRHRSTGDVERVKVTALVRQLSAVMHRVVSRDPRGQTALLRANESAVRIEHARRSAFWARLRGTVCELRSSLTPVSTNKALHDTTVASRSDVTRALSQLRQVTQQCQTLQQLAREEMHRRQQLHDMLSDVVSQEHVMSKAAQVLQPALQSDRRLIARLHLLDDDADDEVELLVYPVEHVTALADLLRECQRCAERLRAAGDVVAPLLTRFLRRRRARRTDKSTLERGLVETAAAPWRRACAELQQLYFRMEALALPADELTETDDTLRVLARIDTAQTQKALQQLSAQLRQLSTDATHAELQATVAEEPSTVREKHADDYTEQAVQTTQRIVEARALIDDSKAEALHDALLQLQLSHARIVDADVDADIVDLPLSNETLVSLIQESSESDYEQDEIDFTKLDMDRLMQQRLRAREKLETTLSTAQEASDDQLQAAALHEYEVTLAHLDALEQHQQSTDTTAKQNTLKQVLQSRRERRQAMLRRRQQQRLQVRAQLEQQTAQSLSLSASAVLEQARALAQAMLARAQYEVQQVTQVAEEAILADLQREFAAARADVARQLDMADASELQHAPSEQRRELQQRQRERRKRQMAQVDLSHQQRQAQAKEALWRQHMESLCRCLRTHEKDTVRELFAPLLKHQDSIEEEGTEAEQEARTALREHAVEAVRCLCQPRHTREIDALRRTQWNDLARLLELPLEEIKVTPQQRIEMQRQVQALRVRQAGEVRRHLSVLGAEVLQQHDICANVERVENELRRARRGTRGGSTDAEQPARSFAKQLELLKRQRETLRLELIEAGLSDNDIAGGVGAVRGVAAAVGKLNARLRAMREEKQGAKRDETELAEAKAMEQQEMLSLPQQLSRRLQETEQVLQKLLQRYGVEGDEGAALPRQRHILEHALRTHLTEKKPEVLSPKEVATQLSDVPSRRLWTSLLHACRPTHVHVTSDTDRVGESGTDNVIRCCTQDGEVYVPLQRLQATTASFGDTLVAAARALTAYELSEKPDADDGLLAMTLCEKVASLVSATLPHEGTDSSSRRMAALRRRARLPVLSHEVMTSAERQGVTFASLWRHALAPPTSSSVGSSKGNNETMRRIRELERERLLEDVFGERNNR